MLSIDPSGREETLNTRQNQHRFNFSESLTTNTASIQAIYFAFCLFCLFVFVVLRPMSTAMVIAGRAVHLTTLFPGQA